MKDFDYFQPTKIRFGCGRVNEIGAAVAQFGRRCLLVTVPSFPAVEQYYEKVKASLSSSGLEIAHFDQVFPNPTTEIVSDGAAMARAFGADVVLGLGGGSSIDTAKAVAVEARHAGTAWDYLYFRGSQPTERTLPILAVPTTSGTGSHVTQVAVITRTEERNKSAIFHPAIYPKLSIVDPELMLTMPEHATAVTGFDVFTHAFESYINPNGSPYTDMLAKEALRIVARSLPNAVKRGSDLGSRIRMAWADTLAGLCIANSGVTLPHGIGMAISGLYPHIMHGEALAVIYPAIMHFSYAAAPKKFAAAAGIFNPKLAAMDTGRAAARFPDIMQDFLAQIGLLTSLQEMGIPETELAGLAEAALVLPDYKNHPRVADYADVLEILKQSFEGGK